MEVKEAEYQAFAGQLCKQMPGMVGPALHMRQFAAWGADADNGEERDGAGNGCASKRWHKLAQHCTCASGCAASSLQVVTMAKEKVLLDSCTGIDITPSNPIWVDKGLGDYV